ncbi:MAG: ATP-dependent DNA helicase RecG [Candidatus Lloydbacteria bacterium RIFCSPHIGHO2_02_FULL_54_17]|uniref:DNA 3'-5' helicase n=1 Tax=Candidatus Lloydbacteria bacterium RIFCSPHIGHO2_02_FULL_54_17 TaxID=1798664 RepID=A0A1G2DG96_9BACT|nr:MAG: ATP-dependent DNA helicase RecG [Candidatus Lloydbacteria bacterium RIFCSPHIGHO2_01_FULL_54_11]OGZ11808.1 MAG: ATP-dependent DNA helicase RecG [Candidatus Lloydbacteria bacterium RIFCSPHIGHO2_02_FULL_54_17]OGZ14337.1 MAG: ATP-dependent DNA helicase RecG [Candidatus Lloydbacteria bacterium RIFCSPLOWO2_01_FULL_54_18]OGZ16003.1 MAG: ATP-dependent DNA helicase RecG [Candidatus Lloydbacteria bacterium RIFCSPLOWO2_02_FULL_54_12]
MPNFSRNDALIFLRRSLQSPIADFRAGQWEAIDALVNRTKKLLVVERTGWGKSSVYFIATRMLRDSGKGPTLIVSPLLALMRNQIEAASRLGISALTINSTNTENWPELIRTVRSGDVDALLISPERLANDDFVRDVLLPIAESIGLLVVDEAHCISDWGHDFRPDYRRLVSILQHLPPNVPLLGTTATANDRVINDIQTQLGDIEIQRGPLLRETLALQTISLPDQSARLAWLADNLPNIDGTGIVYTLTKRDADRVSDWLNSRGIAARSYYSDVTSLEHPDPNEYRKHLEGLLLNNEIKVLVATVALGMGYDKPDLGFVIHFQAPGSIVSYYQQVGRAGRAIDHAVGILLSGKEDDDIQEYFRESAFPSERTVNSLLSLLEEHDGLNVRDIEGYINISKGKIEQVLKYLSVESPPPVLKIGSQWRRTPTAYRMDHEKINRLTRQRIVEWEEVQGYIQSEECLMVYLSRALDDAHARVCNKCANCLGHPVVSETYSDKVTVEAALFLKTSEMPLECKKQVAPGAFPIYSFSGNLPINLRAETGRTLSRWGDAGWGHNVRDDKHEDRFSDELVMAVFEMISKRWKPQPAPTWVTCVPSLRHPELVPDFARRVAAQLELPFIEVVTKLRDNDPQKLQENRFHQCSNLDGVFSVADSIPVGPALLIDDIVDSAWTMTVVAALLRRAGSGPIWPVALATTSNA